jgi:nitrate reductase beta subunit
VRIRKIALPLYPQFGLEPNVYYIPPVHVPPKFLKQMFGPGVEDAIAAYRNAANDLDLAGLLCLFGSSDQIMPRWRRQGDTVIGLDESGKELRRIPMNEPVHIRPAFDARQQLVRINCP